VDIHMIVDRKCSSRAVMKRATDALPAG